MITTPVSAYLECLQNAKIKHNLFIGSERNELQLWSEKRLTETLTLLESVGIKISSIVAMPDTDPEYPNQDYYIIKF